MRILLADENERSRGPVEAVLREEGHTVETVAADLETIKCQGTADKVLILSLRRACPGGDDLLRHLRESGWSAPILLLVPAAEEGIQGLDAGADDFLVRPPRARELLARLRALARRSQAPAVVLRLHGLEMDLTRRRVSLDGEQIELTNREFLLLELLMRASPAPLSKEQIVAKLWGGATTLSTNVVNVFMNRLRNKVLRPHSPLSLRTVRGVGFALRGNSDLPSA
jgi:DNA-binding response OmpR family regulator